MKKIFSTFIIAIFAVALMAGGAMASTMTVTNGTKTDYRLCGAAAYAIGPIAGNADADDIRYTSSVPLPGNSILQFTLTNGKWAADTYYLVKQTAAAGSDDEVAMTVLAAAGLQLEFNINALAIANGDVFFIAQVIVLPLITLLQICRILQLTKEW